RAIAAFNDSVQLLAGEASLQITANGLLLPEDVIQKLTWVWDFGSMSPLVEGRAVLPQFNGEPVQIFGIDLLSEAAFRRYVLSDRTELTDRISREEFIDLILDPHEVILTSALASRLHLVKNSPVEILIGDRRHTFKVGAILRQEGAARAFSGNVIFLDIAAAQTALGKVGRLDRIDVHLRDPNDANTVRKRIEASLGPVAVVDAPEAAALQNEKLSRAFRYNLSALSYIALLVGVILIHNTLTIAVLRRRSEIGMLRALGASRGK